MKAHDVFQSDYLKAADLSDGGDDYLTKIVTITDIETSKPFDDGNTQRLLSFREIDKKLGLNKTNWNKIATLTKQDDDENWKGHKIELWVDPDVSYGGKTVPGIRVRKVSVTNPANASAQLPPIEGMTTAGALPLATKVTAWAAWKRAALEAGETADPIKFKSAADIEATNSRTPIESFTAANWANVATAYRSALQVAEDEIPF